jgi:hypothetical protein
MRFFFYGTLMDRDLLSAVLGRPIKHSDLKPALAKGYRRVTARGLNYPLAVIDKSGSIKGVMLERVSAAGRQRLIAYENPEYRLVCAAVQAPAGMHVKAFLFAAKPIAFIVTGRFWSLARWQKRYKASALAWIKKQRWRKVEV